MDIVAQEKGKSKRYLPHTVSTKEGAVRLFRQTKDIGFVLRRYHISKASLMRWSKLYNGTREALIPKSHRPHSQHPNAHTEELRWLRNYHRRNPNISICKLYGKLRQEKAYSRHPGSLYRVFVRLGYRKKVESTKKESKHLGHYNTPTELGKKWQMDVKYVPAACYVGTDGEKFYQYTMIEEASRERFLCACRENSTAPQTLCSVQFDTLAVHLTQSRQTTAENIPTRKRRSECILRMPFAPDFPFSTRRSVRKRHGITARWNAATGTTKSGSTITRSSILMRSCSADAALLTWSPPGFADSSRASPLPPSVKPFCKTCNSLALFPVSHH